MLLEYGAMDFVVEAPYTHRVRNKMHVGAHMTVKRRWHDGLAYSRTYVATVRLRNAMGFSMQIVLSMLICMH